MEQFGRAYWWRSPDIIMKWFTNTSLTANMSKTRFMSYSRYVYSTPNIHFRQAYIKGAMEIRCMYVLLLSIPE